MLFPADAPAVNADGAVNYEFEPSGSAATDAYLQLLHRITHIIAIKKAVGVYAYAVSCARNGCGANSPASLHPTLGQTFFDGRKGLLAHFWGAHRAEMIEAFGDKSVSKEEITDYQDFCRLQPVTPNDLRYILAGIVPPAMDRETGKNRAEAGRKSGRGPGRPRKRALQEGGESQDEGVFSGPQPKLPRKHGM